MKRTSAIEDNTQRQPGAGPAADAGGGGSQSASVVYEVVFPSREAAAASPRVLVRHARDPELEERQLVHRLNKPLERAAALHAIGEASRGGATTGIPGLDSWSPPSSPPYGSVPFLLHLIIHASLHYRICVPECIHQWPLSLNKPIQTPIPRSLIAHPPASWSLLRAGDGCHGFCLSGHDCLSFNPSPCCLLEGAQ